MDISHKTFLSRLLQLLASQKGREIWPHWEVICNRWDRLDIVVKCTVPGIWGCYELCFTEKTTTLLEMGSAIENIANQAEKWRFKCLGCRNCNSVFQEQLYLWWAVCSGLPFSNYPVIGGQYVRGKLMMAKTAKICLICAKFVDNASFVCICGEDKCHDKINFVTKYMIAYMFLTTVIERDVCWQVGLHLAKLCCLECST